MVHVVVQVRLVRVRFAQEYVFQDRRLKVMKIRYAFPLAFVVFLVGFVTFYVSVTSHSTSHSISPFVITHARYWKSAPEKRQIIVRSVNDKGKSFEKLLAPDGSDLKHALVEYDWHSIDPDVLIKSEYFDRIEKFHGLTAYVLRQRLDDAEIIETWRSRETGPIVLKQIIEKSTGDAIITEAVSIEFRKVSDEEMVPRSELLIELPRQLQR